MHLLFYPKVVSWHQTSQKKKKERERFPGRTLKNKSLCPQLFFVPLIYLILRI